MLKLLTVTFLISGIAFGSNPEKGCGNNPADLVFVLDESGSIWGPDFTRMLNFVQDVIGTFDVGFNRTHVGTMTFGTNNRIIFPLGKYTAENDLKAAVNETTQMRGETYTHLALQRMRTEMFSPQYSRWWVRHVAIVITDGESNYPKETEKEADLAHWENIQMLAIGVGDQVDRKELETIASSPDLVFTVDNYAALESLRNNLAWKACETSTTPTTTTTTTQPPPMMIEGCNGYRQMDHIWSISEQAGVTETNHALDFIKSVTSNMTIGPLHVQVGLAPRFCEEAKAIRLKDHDTKDGFWRDLDRRRLTGLRTGLTIEYIRTRGISASNGGRSDSVKYGILLVDNTSQDWEKTLREAVLAKEAGVRLIVIGIGQNIRESQLKELASSQEDYFYVSSYAKLADKNSSLIQRLCEGIIGSKVQHRSYFDPYFY